MDQKQTLTATSHADLLAAIPRLAGYQPERSIVIAPLAQAHIHGILRVDLPEKVSAEDADALTSYLARIPGANAAIVIIYTDDAPAARGSVNTLVERFAAADILVTEALYVTGDSWGCYLCKDDSPQPAAWISASEHSDPSLPTFSQTHRIPARDEIAAAGIAACIGDYPSVTFDPLKVIEKAATTTPEDMRAEDAAQLLAVLVRPSLRDVALIQWARNTETGADALATQLQYHLTAKIDQRVAETLLGHGERPDVARLGNALAVCRYLAANTVDVHAAAAFVSAGWIAWALGRSSEAFTYVQQATQIDPDLTFADLLTRVLNGGILPEWAFNRP